MSGDELTKHLQGISTRDFLSILDADQLFVAVEIARELMEKKDKETRVPLWVVSTDCVNVSAFRKEDYAKAVDRARRLVDEEATTGCGLIVQIESLLIRESEVADMLALSV